MGYPTKVQLIKRKASEQWYINFPAALAQAMDFDRGETVEWFVEDRSTLVLRRSGVADLGLGQAKKGGSRASSATSSTRAKTPSQKKRPSGGPKA